MVFGKCYSRNRRRASPRVRTAKVFALRDSLFAPEPERLDHRTVVDREQDRVLVEGVSLVTTYRGTFSAEVQHSGIDGLIKVLEAKNRTLAKD